MLTLPWGFGEAPPERPDPVASRRTKRTITDLPDDLRDDMDQLRVYCERVHRSRHYKDDLARLGREAYGFLKAGSFGSCGLQPLREQPIARRFMVWSGRPLDDGRLRSINTFIIGYALLRNLWGAWGIKPVDVRDRIHELQASFTLDGDYRGRPVVDVNLRDPDPAPAPDLKMAEALLRLLLERIKDAEDTGDLLRRRRAWRDLAVVLTAGVNGLRTESIPSERLDRTVVAPDGVLTTTVIAKGTPKLKSAPSLRWPAGEHLDQTYAEWPLFSMLLDVYAKYLDLYGIDLRTYLATRDPSLVRWFVVNEDVTFGREAPPGTRVAPLWLNDRGDGYLRRHTFEKIGRRIVRDDLHLERGQLHVFRALATLLVQDIRSTNPSAAVALMQMSLAQQDDYLLRVRKDLAGTLGVVRLDSGSETVRSTKFTHPLLSLALEASTPSAEPGKVDSTTKPPETRPNARAASTSREPGRDRTRTAARRLRPSDLGM